MKKVFIPSGQTVEYDSLTADLVVVNGFLKVHGPVRAKTIDGSGTLKAESIGADSICVEEVEAARLVCKKLMAKRVFAREVIAADSAMVSCYLSADYVKTDRLTACVLEIEKLYAKEVIHLQHQRGGMLRALLLSGLRSFWTDLHYCREEDGPLNAEYEPVVEEPEETEDGSIRQEIARTVQDYLARQKAEQESADSEDFELNRLVQTFRLLRDQGYTLRILPGTPEANAPVFDFENETILQPAA